MLSIQFSQAEKDGMIMALTKHHPDHAAVDELIATLETVGETVLTETEALILAGLVRPYYCFISDRIINHPAIGDGKLPSITELQDRVLNTSPCLPVPGPVDLTVASYELLYDEAVGNRVLLEMVRGYGCIRWAIRQHGLALGKTPTHGRYFFQMEPLPSNRDDAYYEEYRWPTAEAALTFWNENRPNIIAASAGPYGHP